MIYLLAFTLIVTILILIVFLCVIIQLFHGELESNMDNNLVVPQQSGSSHEVPPRFQPSCLERSSHLTPINT